MDNNTKTSNMTEVSEISEVVSEAVSDVVTEVSKVKPDVKPVMPINPNMDEANKTAANVFNTQGEKAFLKHVFTDQETGRIMSYAEMRCRYG